MSDLTPVRDEDAFDVAKVHDWLSRYIEEGELPEVKQFRSGASNLTYLLKYPDRELVLRRPPIGTKAVSAHDMKREFLIQSRLKPVYDLVPTVIALCEDHSIIGSDFYVMERIKGDIFRRDVPESLTKEDISIMATSLVAGLARLHDVDATVLAELNKGLGYVTRQVEGWSKRYRNALTDDVPDGEDVMSWLAANKPEDVGSCIIHGDWRIDNMVFDLDQKRLVGVLDWELATVGDPLMDLGSALAYWVDRDDDLEFASLRRQPSHLEGMPTRREFIAKYLELSGRKCDDFTFYEVFGLFRLTVIIQQIWARYRAGQTTNPAFKGFGVGVNILIKRAQGLIS
ncbi:MAG: phosphotransferase family protein [Actinobacteria bacterium]|nr:phosphotransferase family protein [Actinomycetota bacterium]NCW75978.1 phosphotransferase family protein [Actinomycetota bacterium]NCW97003.1 phosphotransferase family protein [Actinomycetota bacterium]NCX00711.1 phosphotransferase family protein [Actinomycetota bacterium]